MILKLLLSSKMIAPVFKSFWQLSKSEQIKRLGTIVPNYENKTRNKFEIVVLFLLHSFSYNEKELV